VIWIRLSNVVAQWCGENTDHRLELGKSSVQTIIGRIDAKGTGAFYDSYIAKDQDR